VEKLDVQNFYTIEVGTILLVQLINANVFVLGANELMKSTPGVNLSSFFT